MRHFDVFNGDADGICALHQLRLAEPVESELVTGLKRDLALLGRVDAQAGDVVTVLDVSLERNRPELERLLERGAIVRYFDHHHAASAPRHPNLTAVIDPSPTTCTSTLVDLHLAGRHRPWAVVGAFGDGLAAVAHELARTLGVGVRALEVLSDLGATLNYNAYGESEGDAIVPPLDLYRIVSRYTDPFELVTHEALIARLSRQRMADLEQALQTPPIRSRPGFDAYLLPDAPWSRRVSGTFANRLVLSDPRRAYAVLTPLASGGYVVSVRSPREWGISAAEFCRRYAGGGGREAAGGIDRLQPEILGPFLDDLAGVPWRTH